MSFMSERSREAAQSKTVPTRSSLLTHEYSLRRPHKKRFDFTLSIIVLCIVKLFARTNEGTADDRQSYS
jgi:hypothetical protein